MPPRPALALAKPDARFLDRHGTTAMDVTVFDTAGSPAPAQVKLNSVSKNDGQTLGPIC